jgi:hypothetical protein
MGSPLDNIRSLFSARGGTSEVSPVAPAKRVVEVPGVDRYHTRSVIPYTASLVALMHL